MANYPYFGYYQQPQYQNNQSNQNIIWISGEQGAKSYITAPNTSVLLMDSENNTFYIKTTDQTGMPMPLRIFDYTERTQQNVNIANIPVDKNSGIDESIRKEISDLWAKYAELERKVGADNAE